MKQLFKERDLDIILINDELANADLQGPSKVNQKYGSYISEIDKKINFVDTFGKNKVLLKSAKGLIF